MSSNDIQSAFQNQFSQSLTGVLTAHDIAVEIVRRDQRRIRFLAALCLLLWLVGGAGVGVLVVGLNQFVMGVRLSNWEQYKARTAELNKQMESLNSSDTSEKSEDRATDLDIKMGETDKMFQLDGTDLLHHSLPYIDGALVCLLLAALCTVWLVFASRRTTLNRINISLAQISEQLKQIRALQP
jgi:hypothetical protein